MRGLLRRPLLALIVVLLAALGVLVWRFVVAGSGRPVGAAVDQARAAGRQIAINISSYDYTKLDAQFAVIAGTLTGPALTQFQSNKTMIQKSLTTNKIALLATVDDDAVVPGATTTTADVMVALTVAESVSGRTQGSTSVLVRLALVRIGSVWKAQTIGNVSG